MRNIIFILFLALSSAVAQDSPRPEPLWRTQLAGRTAALEAVEQFEAILSGGSLTDLDEHLPGGRLRLRLIEPGLPDGLYGAAQSRSILESWLAPLRGRQMRIARTQLNEDRSRLGLLLQWPPQSSGDLHPQRQLICELGLDGPSWTFESATAP